MIVLLAVPALSCVVKHSGKQAWRDHALSFHHGEGKTSGERPGATAAAAGRASEAMFAGSDGPRIQKVRCDVPQEQWFSILHLQAEHLVEVAVVDLDLPDHAQSGA